MRFLRIPPSHQQFRDGSRGRSPTTRNCAVVSMLLQIITRVLFWLQPDNFKTGVYPVESVPRSVSGKLLRRILRDQARLEIQRQAKARLWYTPVLERIVYLKTWTTWERECRKYDEGRIFDDVCYPAIAVLLDGEVSAWSTEMDPYPPCDGRMRESSASSTSGMIRSGGRSMGEAYRFQSVSSSCLGYEVYSGDVGTLLTTVEAEVAEEKWEVITVEIKLRSRSIKHLSSIRPPYRFIVHRFATNRPMPKWHLGHSRRSKSPSPWRHQDHHTGSQSGCRHHLLWMMLTAGLTACMTILMSPGTGWFGSPWVTQMSQNFNPSNRLQNKCLCLITHLRSGWKSKCP